MSQSVSLSGSTVLVVEDDFYLAEDQREALEAAGATVLGPCPTVAEALALLRDHEPDCAILDVSLTDGPSFDLARAIVHRGIPMLFVTGYEASSIPSDLTGLVRLQKPVTAPKILAAAAEVRQSGGYGRMFDNER